MNKEFKKADNLTARNEPQICCETNKNVFKYNFAELILLATGIFYIVNYFTQII